MHRACELAAPRRACCVTPGLAAAPRAAVFPQPAYQQATARPTAILTHAQVWLPRPRGPRGSLWLSVEGAPFRLTDAALLAFRERSSQLSFAKGQGLPGRVWASGACELIQDVEFCTTVRTLAERLDSRVSLTVLWQAHYSLRELGLSEGLQETVCMPIFAPNEPEGPILRTPVGVLEVLLASSAHAANGSKLAVLGRARLSFGGSAGVISSLASALDAAGLSGSSCDTPLPSPSDLDTHISAPDARISNGGMGARTMSTRALAQRVPAFV